MKLGAFLWTWLFLALMRAGLAHDPNLSSVMIELDGNAGMVTVTAHLGKVELDVEDALQRRLMLTIDGKPFVAAKPEVKIDQEAATVRWRASLPTGSRQFAIRERLFPEDPTSRTVVSVFRDGELLKGGVLDAASSEFAFGEQTQPNLAATIGEYVKQGVEHIFLGFDHICFVVGLLLLGGTLRQILKTVTAFTVAHSITLSIAATGVWSPPGRWIEPLIALSIVAVAYENIRSVRNKSAVAKQAKADWRPWVAFGFGLIHGFGFAGALADVGLPSQALGWALASFNVGVELGQAAIVVILAPLLAWVVRAKPVSRRPIVIGGSAAIGLLGAFWFVQRIWG